MSRLDRLGEPRAGRGRLVPLDIDATIVIAHSDEQQAAPTWKKTFGFHRAPALFPRRTAILGG
ncbi:hypothetical protein [Microbispora sp. NPDC046933]|uniref:hypothetical protein n=1 Tax=Microbispora sp. NPDC046933 TaxID=3155618 RepID=UPI0033C7F122